MIMDIGLELCAGWLTVIISPGNMLNFLAQFPGDIIFL